MRVGWAVTGMIIGAVGFFVPVYYPYIIGLGLLLLLWGIFATKKPKMSV